MRQLPFQFPVESSYRADDYIVTACNEAAWKQLNQWPDWPQPALLLRGPKASGKTHLASVWARRHNAAMLQAADIQQEDSPESYSAGSDCLVIENIEAVVDESILFHFLNHQRQSPQPVLLTVDEASCWGGFDLPDLQSRLQALPQVRIDEPDDELLKLVMVKQFADVQRYVEPAVVSYLTTRIERSFDAVKETVKRLELIAAAKKQPVTVALARQFLTEC